uniref:BHLH domain-containing protein n=1 Tax=Leersia perrieri TaxID=77586 RepID=A0A0D9WKD1_9ORYZ
MDKETSHLDSFAPPPEDPPVVAGGEAAVYRSTTAGEFLRCFYGEMVDYMLGQPPPPTPGPQSHVSPFDKLTFSDVLQFADFGPKLALNQPAATDNAGDDDINDDDDDDDSYFLRFQSLPSLPAVPHPPPPPRGAADEEGSKQTTAGDGGGCCGGGGLSESTTTLVNQAAAEKEGGGKSGRRKRPRTVKTSEEVESQRMTHIAVERNRRRQMNDYLRLLRSLMPSSYVQRGDQASIIGGAIEFIRELEQLIQCLESQKRRRLYGGDAPPPPPPPPPRPVAADGSAPVLPMTPAMSFVFPPSIPFPASSGDAAADKIALDLDGGGEVREEMAENKSCLGDIEVRLLGVDAMIKILSRRRPGQLIKTVAALEDMQMSILHTNITTIDQTVLYSFNVKIAGEARFSAEDIAGAVHQILSFIDVNYTL